jgi:hypothetical protein
VLLGVFLGVLFEIRTFLVGRNHMILSYKMTFSSISADPPLLVVASAKAPYGENLKGFFVHSRF